MKRLKENCDCRSFGKELYYDGEHYHSLEDYGAGNAGNFHSDDYHYAGHDADEEVFPAG